MTSRLAKWHGIVTNRSLGHTIVALIFVAIIGLELTAQSVMREMEDLPNGRYDNSLWFVSRMEVDFQRLLLAIHGAIDVAPPATRSQAIAEVVSSFDIYFSRVEMVSARTSNVAIATYDPTAPLLEMDQIKAHLYALAPLVDNSAGQDADYFRHLLLLISPISPELHRNIMGSLQSTIQSNAEITANRAFVLRWLLMLTQGMAVLLFGIAGVVFWLSWQLNRRNLDFARMSSNLNKAIETSLDAVVITDSSGRISTFNSAAETMFGRTFAKVKGQLTEDLLHSGPKADRKGRLSGRQLATSLQQSADRGRVRLTLHKGDGSDFMVEVAIATAVDSDGAPIFLAFLRDITKLVEADGKERAARFEAERNAKANARFLAVMGHEMRTPLHGIISSLELLEGENTPDERAALRKIARDSAGSALEQIQEVLELAQHDAADVSGVLLTFFPAEVARIIVEQSQSLAADNHTSLTLIVEPTLSGPMHGNRRAFRSALANLVGNAIKFTQNGTIVVRLHPTPDAEGFMRVEVTDSGIGIEQQDQLRIFDDFETVSVTSPETFGASGLGLGIARRAVALMGGTLDMASNFGFGSRFWFDISQNAALPIAADKSAGVQRTLVGPALTVLVVDDNAINRALLAQMLERQGHKVEIARDGPSAVDAAKGKPYDIILMDINMPGMDGVEATRQIRAAGACSNVPIMGITANARPQDLEVFALAGLNSTLIKPVTSAALALQVQAMTSPQADLRAGSTIIPLIALENFRDLQAALKPDDLLAIAKTALTEASAALSDARTAALGAAIATQLHHAAGSAGVIGAHRLHMLLGKLEDAARAGQRGALLALIDEADTARQETDNWFGAANRKLNGSVTAGKIQN